MGSSRIWIALLLVVSAISNDETLEERGAIMTQPSPVGQSTAPKTGSSLRKAEGVVAILLTLSVVSLHLIAAISAGALWRDEANTVGLSTLPSLGDVWNYLQFDSFPILWLLIIRGFSEVMGPMNDPAFRALGFCVGVGVVAVLWINARTFRHSYPLVSMTLLGMSPSLIVWGDSMRAYGLGILLILLTGALLWRFVEQPGTARFATAALGAVVSVHTLFYNAVLLLALCGGGVAVCLLRRAWKKAGLVVLIGLLSAISLLPYAATLRSASNWNKLVQIPGYDLNWFWFKLFETLDSGGFWAVIGWIGFVISAVIAGTVAVSFPRQLGLSEKRRTIVLFCLVTLCIGGLAVFLFLDALSYLTQPWYYLGLVALAGVTVDALFGALIHTPAFRIARLVAVLLLGSMTLGPAARAVSTRKTNVDMVAARVQAVAGPDDVVLVAPWYYGVTFARYYRGYAAWMGIPSVGFYRVHRYDIVKTMMMMPDQTLPVRAMTDRAGDALRAGHRVFIVGDPDNSYRSQIPVPLPAAPHPGKNPWPEDLYHIQWSLMVRYFLHQHASTLVAMPVNAGSAVSKYENVQLFVATGWRP